MLRLNLSRTPTWLDLAPGVRIQLLPADIELVAEAQSDPAFRAALGSDDLPEDDAAALAMSATAKQRVGLALAIALAKRAVVAWEGMADENGKPLPDPFDDGVEALIRIPSVMRKFQAEYMAPALDLVAEGNGSGASRNGISAAVPTIAQPARRPAKPAPKGKARH
jgi:hypothetical protein